MYLTRFEVRRQSNLRFPALVTWASYKNKISYLQIKLRNKNSYNLNLIIKILKLVNLIIRKATINHFLLKKTMNLIVGLLQHLHMMFQGNA